MMPLNLPTLTTELEALSTPTPSASMPPASVAAAAAAWAGAVQSYAAAVVPPSSTVTAAASVLETALGGAFAARPDAAAAMELAFVAFATTVGGGMAGFVPAPPPGPVGFAGLFSGPSPTTHAAAAAAMAGVIDTWMRTGAATPIAGGPPVVWS